MAQGNLIIVSKFKETLCFKAMNMKEAERSDTHHVGKTIVKQTGKPRKVFL